MTKQTSNTGLSPSLVGLSNPLPFACLRQSRGPTTPIPPRRGGFGLFPGRSPLLGESLLFSFPSGTKMFQFPELAPAKQVTGLQPDRLSHSEIRGSRVICT